MADLGGQSDRTYELLSGLRAETAPGRPGGAAFESAWVLIGFDGLLDGVECLDWSET